MHNSANAAELMFTAVNALRDSLKRFCSDQHRSRFRSSGSQPAFQPAGEMCHDTGRTLAAHPVRTSTGGELSTRVGSGRRASGPGPTHCVASLLFVNQCCGLAAFGFHTASDFNTSQMGGAPSDLNMTREGHLLT